jgi:hypothetical protein
MSASCRNILWRDCYLPTAARLRLTIGDLHDNHVAQIKLGNALHFQVGSAQAHHRKGYMLSSMAMSRFSID